MKYSEPKMIGDIGELIVAKSFIAYFRWPCRSQGIDLGIDAEVEITDAQAKATGKVVKVQVKATNRPFQDGINTVTLDQTHIDYWKRFSVPVLLCHVCIATEEILWTVIDPKIDYSTGKGAKIDLDRTKDALIPNSKAALEKIAVHGSDPIMQVLGLVEASILGFYGGNNQIMISSDDENDIKAHRNNQNILSLAYQLINLNIGRSTQASQTRLAQLQQLCNSIDQELDRQGYADLY